MFTGQDEFPRPPIGKGKGTVTPGARMLRPTFLDLEPGGHAVGVCRDLSGTRRLDAAVARKPNEPRGISNDPRPNDRSPTWGEGEFTLPPEAARIVSELR